MINYVQIVSELEKNIKQCESIKNEFNLSIIKAQIESLVNAALRVSEAWSGSFLGYHAYVYLRDFRSKSDSDYFDTEFGLSGSYFPRSEGEWIEYSHEDILNQIIRRASLRKENVGIINEGIARLHSDFLQQKKDALSWVEIILKDYKDGYLLTEFEALKSVYFKTKDMFNKSQFPKQYLTLDYRAGGQGFCVPVHTDVISLSLYVESIIHSYGQLQQILSGIINHLKKIQTFKMTNEQTNVEKSIFIGHGKSLQWYVLKDFLENSLKIKCNEFNSEPTAGLSTKERLVELLNTSSFAFLIMTAEDEMADNTKQARANVIHEIGLFQGKLGFEKAIILLEESCSEFSNIVGLTQIRFPKEQIKSCFEQIREVLRREGILLHS